MGSTLNEERRELNTIAPCLMRRRTPLWAAIADRMQEVIRREPGLTLRELVFSKCNWLVRSVSARTVESLWSLCGELLDRFTEAERRNCFTHGGYRCT